MNPITIVQDLKLKGRSKSEDIDSTLIEFSNPQMCPLKLVKLNGRCVEFSYEADDFSLCWYLDTYTGYVSSEYKVAIIFSGEPTKDRQISTSVFGWYLFKRLVAESDFASSNEVLKAATGWNRMIDLANEKIAETNPFARR